MDSRDVQGAESLRFDLPYARHGRDARRVAGDVPEGEGERVMEEQQIREIRERAFYLNSVDDGGVQRCGDDIYDLLAALAARDAEITRLRDEVIWADHIREEREDDL